jgi:hypothetical protein
MLKAHNVVIASVSEAIQAASTELDCFVASAPRNDVDDDAPPAAVIPRLDRGIQYAASFRFYH